MSRVLTSAVQLFLLASVVYCVRLMWADLKHDVTETIKDLKK
jgi:hypothetical protein